MDYPHDITREMDGDGELYGVISVDAHGHLDFAEAELFMALVVNEELYEEEEHTHSFGIEIEHLWRTTHPLDRDDYASSDGERWTYWYTTDERPGSIAVTRFQVASPWARAAVTPLGAHATRDPKSGEWIEEGVDYFPVMCVNHPDERARVGMPESRFVESERTKALEGLIHYCHPCADDFHRRWDEAVRVAVAERELEF